MAIHYNAFISYRHHPDDIRVASQIHRALEHYKVPRAIRKNSKGITRIFRDKDELPITSNLTTDITQALENSDYLIVICSTHTKESAWVQREIETFLQTHDRSKVLTVLVNGEPYDTIPEILLREERTDPITGQTVFVPIEPLSCDWRMPARKAKREELPRLAAALLNCGYNELRQRERQYRTRRMIAAFSLALSVSLGFMGYFIYSNTQIQRANEQLFNANLQITANLEQALENQSQFLANASSEVLDEGDRLTAMLLALEALPEYEGERPYVATAEQALATAVGAYLADTQILAVGAFDCGALVNAFKITPDGSTIYILDERNNLSVWDTETFQQISTTTLPTTFTGSSIEMLPTAAGNMLVISSWDDLVGCFSPDGQILWQDADCDDLAFLGENDTLMLLNSTYIVDTDSYRMTIRFLDSNTGAPVRDELLILNEGPTMRGSSFLMDTYPADAAISMEFYSNDARFSIALDPETGKLTTLSTYHKNALVTGAGYTSEGNIVLSVIADGYSSLSGYYQNMIMTQASDYRIQCFTTSGYLLWENPVTTYIYGFANTIQMIPGSSNLFCLLNNTIFIIDSITGEIVNQCETGSSPLFARVEETKATIFLKDGSNGNYRYSSNLFTATQYSKDNLDIGMINHGLYAYEYLSHKVIVYRSIRDESYNAYGGDYSDLVIRKQMTHNNLLAIETYTGLYLFDMQSKKLLWSDGGDYSFDTEIMGFSEDDSILWCLYSDDTVVAYDIRTGSRREYILPGQEEYPKLYYSDQHRMVGTKIFCSADIRKNAEELHLICWDTVTKEHQDYLICEADSLAYNAQVVVLDANINRALLWENVYNRILHLDFASGDLTTIAADVTARPSAYIRDENSFLLGFNHEIQLRTFDGEVLVQVSLGEKNAVSFYGMDDMFLAMCDGGDIYRYAWDGTFLSRIGLHLYNTFYSNVTSNSFDPSQIAWCMTEGGDLVVNAFNYGNVIDCTNWNRKATIPDLVAYAPALNELVLKSNSEDVPDIVSYHLRSTEELKQMALDALNGLELTEEQRSFYGLLEE